MENPATVVNTQILGNPLPIAISTATHEEIFTVTGFTFRRMCDGPVWDLKTDNNLDDFEISDAFKVQKTRVENWFGNQDVTTSRSKVDAYILEAAEHLESLKFFGEAAFQQYDAVSQITLTGGTDYSLVYGGPGRRADDVTFILDVVGSDVGINTEVLKRLCTYLATAFNARKVAKMKNPGVFGAISDGTLWQFWKIDDLGNSSRSGIYDETLAGDNFILSSLVYVMASAQANSLATSQGNREPLAPHIKMLRRAED